MGNMLVIDRKQFFSQIDSYLSGEDSCRVKEAYELARRAHGNQRRQSGELFFTHPLTVAYYISEYQLEAEAIIAALLHDVAEDTRITLKEIEDRFGSEVALLVDGVTKLKDVTKGVSTGKKLSKKEIEDATLHKLLGVMTRDVRAVIIKIFDRLHNMRTISATAPERQEYKAKETLAVYAPLANRLGIWKIKSELEALALEVLDNKAYNIIKQQREQLLREQQETFQLISGQIFEVLLQTGIDVRNVLLAPENIYTIYNDLCEHGASIHDMDKTMRLVILVNEMPACYLALGYLHQLWQPVPGKFDDYIAAPRENLYRSLHTTVVHTDGQHLKLRLRTVAMDMVDDIGILARWLYKGTPLWTPNVTTRIDAFLENITDNINLEPQNPTAGLKGVMEDVFGRQIRVFTPRGAVKELVKGATPIDFAYAIHTGLGDQCSAAYVNDVAYPLNKPLHDGDRVRIIKRDQAQPQRAWLDEDLGYIATNYARAHARRWFRRLKPPEAVAEGKYLLQHELTMIGFPDYSHEKIAQMFQYADKMTFYYDLGLAELLPTTVAVRVLEKKWVNGPAYNLDNTVTSKSGERFVVTHADGRSLRLCGTCHPQPPDNIVGFLRKDGGVTVHKQGCPTLHKRLKRRLLKLGWGEAPRQARLVNIQVKVYDRPGLLYDITNLMQDEHMNIPYIHTPPTNRPGEVHLVMTLEVVEPRQLVRILHQIEELPNVFFVQAFPENITKDNLLPPNSLYRPE